MAEQDKSANSNNSPLIGKSANQHTSATSNKKSIKGDSAKHNICELSEEYLVQVAEQVQSFSEKEMEKSHIQLLVFSRTR